MSKGGDNRLVVLISGRGSNFAALADACADDRVPGQVAAVISDRAEAGRAWWIVADQIAGHLRHHPD